MNLQGMQVVATKDKTGKLVRTRPADTNTKAMSMGSWHAALSKGGELTGKKRGKLAAVASGAPVGTLTKGKGKK